EPGVDRDGLGRGAGARGDPRQHRPGDDLGRGRTIPSGLDRAGRTAAGGMIYLDYQATTPLAPEARDAMLPWFDRYGNPHSPHRLGREAAAAIEVAAEQVAVTLGDER